MLFRLIDVDLPIHGAGDVDVVLAGSGSLDDRLAGDGSCGLGVGIRHGIEQGVAIVTLQLKGRGGSLRVVGVGNGNQFERASG